MIPRALHDVFDKIAKARITPLQQLQQPQSLTEALWQDSPAHSYEVKLSYLQLYINQVYDLLSEDPTPLNIREHAKDSHSVEGLTVHPVQSIADVVALLELGSRSKVSIPLHYPSPAAAPPQRLLQPSQRLLPN